MPFKDSIQDISLPQGSFRLYIPQISSVQTYVSQKTKKEPFPFWAKVWPSAIALAGFIQKNADIVAGKKVAELAAGLALPSLVAAAYAKQVWCSDISPQAMEMATKSASINQLTNMQFEPCNWNQLPPDFKADVVLLSDINYEPSVFDDLENVLKHLMDLGSTLILATPQRLMAKPLFEKLFPFIANQFEEQVFENETPVFISIFILKNHPNL